MLSPILTWKNSTKKPSRIWVIRSKELPIRKSIQLLETVVWADWPHAFWTQWQPSTILHGATVSDMSTVFSDKSSKTDAKSRFLTIGFSTVTPGKLKESISNTKSISVVRLERLLITRAMKDHIGKKLKLSWPEPTIHQFQVMLRLTRSVSDFGNQSQSMNSILLPSTAAIITRLWKPVKRPSILQAFCIQTIPQNKENNCV